MYSESNRRSFGKKVKSDRKSKCWIWKGALIKGYGTFSVGGQQVYAHKFFFEYVNGPVPAGLELDHKCGNPACVNPYHLEAVTHQENMRRAAARGVWDGERNGNSKLTEPEVLEIKRALRQGVPVKKLASNSIVCSRMVYKIATKENWKHVKLESKEEIPDAQPRVPGKKRKRTQG